MCFTCCIFTLNCVSGSHAATISTDLQYVATIRRQGAMKAFTRSNLKSCGNSAFHISVMATFRHSNRFTSGCAAVRCFTTLIRILAWNSKTLYDFIWSSHLLIFKNKLAVTDFLQQKVLNTILTCHFSFLRLVFVSTWWNEVRYSHCFSSGFGLHHPINSAANCSAMLPNTEG